MSQSMKTRKTLREIDFDIPEIRIPEDTKPKKEPFDWYKLHSGMVSFGHFVRDVCIAAFFVSLAAVATQYFNKIALENFVNKLFIMQMGINIPL